MKSTALILAIGTAIFLLIQGGTEVVQQAVRKPAPSLMIETAEGSRTVWMVKDGKRYLISSISVRELDDGNIEFYVRTNDSEVPY